jgi:hypothetical protein
VSSIYSIDSSPPEINRNAGIKPLVKVDNEVLNWSKDIKISKLPQENFDIRMLRRNLVPRKVIKPER